jgi:hypothetical protein
LSLGFQRVKFGVKDLQFGSQKGQNLPCTMTDLLKTSKEKLLVLAENDMQMQNRKKNFYKAFHKIFMHNKRQFFGLFREFKEAN